MTTSDPRIRGEVRGRLQELRLQHGWTQARMGEEVGTGAQTIKEWESGRTLPSLALALRLEAVLGVPLRELFRLEEDADGAERDG